MRAWLLDSFTGIGSMQLRDHPDPAAAADEVLLSVEYAALNPADRYLAEAQYPAKPPLPHILGRDGLGKVIAVGANVREWKIGDTAVILRGDVGVSRAGAFAEKVAVSVDSLVHVPPSWTHEQAAGASLVYLTAYQALTMWENLPASAVTLITGASGGVGVATLQLAKALGHTVICLSRSEAKQKILRDHGADLCLDPNDPIWRNRVKEFLKDKKVDLAVDTIGGALFSDLLDTLGNNGRVSCVGRLAGPVPQFNTASLFFRRLRIGGVAAGTYTREGARSAWHASLDLLKKTGARPIVDRVFPFEDLPAAFARLAEGPMGKVLLKISPT
jgi:NADPH:quinone reductase